MWHWNQKAVSWCLTAILLEIEEHPYRCNLVHHAGRADRVCVCVSLSPSPSWPLHSSLTLVSVLHAQKKSAGFMPLGHVARVSEGFILC